MDEGETHFGVFLEYGNGSYDTYNKFANIGKVEGDGKTSHYGAGLLGRTDYEEEDSGNYYVEGSLRGGQVKNDVRSGVTDALENKARFKTTALYASLHLGGGYLWRLGKTSALDFYGKAFYTYEGGDSIKLSTGDPVKFSPVSSIRLRVGSRYEWTIARFTPYAGLAYEHELDAQAKATAYGYNIDTPDLKGGTGIIEGGVIMKPAPKLPLSLNLGLQGYVGKMRGVTGSLRVKYDF
jgi:outer membrane autotransporter protein